MLSLHALLFSILGTSVFAHPVPVPSPSVGEELQRLLEGQDIGGQTTWIRTIATLSDAHSKDHCDDFITFNPPERPRIGLLLASPGEFHEGNHVEGDLEKVLETIKGTWILRPDSMNPNNRLYDLSVDPDDHERPIQVHKPNPEIIRTADLVSHYDYDVDFNRRLLQ